MYWIMVGEASGSGANAPEPLASLLACDALRHFNELNDMSQELLNLLTTPLVSLDAKLTWLSHSHGTMYAPAVTSLSMSAHAWARSFTSTISSALSILALSLGSS